MGEIYYVSYGVALLVFVGVWVALWSTKRIILTRLKQVAERTSGDLDDALVLILNTIHPIVLGVAGAAFAIRFAQVPEVVMKTVSAAFLVALVYQLSVGAARAVDVWVQKRQGKRIEPGQRAALSFLSLSIKWAIWVVGGLLVLSNLGVNINSLIAGLGIGGIAVALALQNVLSDLFASFSIYFDKPFEVGDFISVGAHRGVVEKIGVKTTRLRALEGEEVVISNAELTSARVQNFKKLQERRAVITIGVLYETPDAALRKIPGILEESIVSVAKTRFERAHFASYGDSALTFECVYYALTSDYGEYMAIKQDILFRIKAAFDREHIGFAYPTQTLYVKRD
jgi:small-conductance mechanosensitive channel